MSVFWELKCLKTTFHSEKSWVSTSASAICCIPCIALTAIHIILDIYDKQIEVSFPLSFSSCSYLCFPIFFYPKHRYLRIRAFPFPLLSTLPVTKSKHEPVDTYSEGLIKLSIRCSYCVASYAWNYAGPLC